MVRIHWFIFNWVDANDCPMVCVCVCVCKNPPWNGCMMHVSGFHLWLYTTPINCLNYLANLSLSHSYIYIYIRSGIYLTFLVIFHVCRCFVHPPGVIRDHSPINILLHHIRLKCSFSERKASESDRWFEIGSLIIKWIKYHAHYKYSDA